MKGRKQIIIGAAITKKFSFKPLAVGEENSDFAHNRMVFRQQTVFLELPLNRYKRRGFW